MDISLVIEIGIALIVLWVVAIVIFWLLRPKDVPIREIVRVVPDLVRLLRSIITDRGAPLDVRIVLVGLMIWIVSPIDLIPEFIPGIGPLDDVIVAIVALRFTRRRMGIEDLRRRWPGTADGFEILTRVVGEG